MASATKSDPEAANRPPPPIRNQTDYMPFPQNEHFKAEPITSQAQRQEVWKMIVVDGLSVKETSARLGIEMSRVGAIVRLQEIERAWMNQVSIHKCFFTIQRKHYDDDFIKSISL